MPAQRRRAVCGLCTWLLIAAACLAAAAGSTATGAPAAGAPAAGAPVADAAAQSVRGAGDQAGAIRYLDSTHPSMSQHFEIAQRDRRRLKFVQVHVVRVLNPRRTGILFEVEFQADNGGKIPLGVFSLYPADNPGIFLVALAHKVKSAGTVILSWRATDPVDPAMPPSVGIGSIDLVEAH
jgi:hypothetical protein